MGAWTSLTSTKPSQFKANTTLHFTPNLPRIRATMTLRILKRQASTDCEDIPVSFSNSACNQHTEDPLRSNNPAQVLKTLTHVAYHPAVSVSFAPTAKFLMLTTRPQLLSACHLYPSTTPPLLGPLVMISTPRDQPMSSWGAKSLPKFVPESSITQSLFNNFLSPLLWSNRARDVDSCQSISNPLKYRIAATQRMICLKKKTLLALVECRLPTWRKA